MKIVSLLLVSARRRYLFLFLAALLFLTGFSDVHVHFRKPVFL